FRKRDRHAGFTESRRLDNQCLTAMLIETFTDTLHGFDLVAPVNDLGLGTKHREPLSFTGLPHPVLQPVFAVEALYAAGHIALAIIPDVDVIPVSIKDDRTLTELLLKTIRVESGLCASFLRIMGSFLRLDEGQWLAIIIPEDIIDVASVRVRGLVWHLDLFANLICTLAIRAHFPACLDEKLIDEQLARGFLVELQRVSGLVCLRQNGLLLFGCLLGSDRLPTRGLQLLQQLLHLRFLRSQLLQGGFL